MKILIAILVGVFVMGCNSKRKDSDRGFVESLNGQSYESSNSVSLVPVFNEEAPIVRKISGKIFCGEGLSQVPAKFAQVQLMDGRNLVESTTSDVTGSYVLLGKIQKSKTYQLKASAKCGSFESPLTWGETPEFIQEIRLKIQD